MRGRGSLGETGVLPGCVAHRHLPRGLAEVGRLRVRSPRLVSRGNRLAERRGRVAARAAQSGVMCSRHDPGEGARSRRSTTSCASACVSKSQRSTLPVSLSPARATTFQRVSRISHTSRRARRPQMPFHHLRTTSSTDPIVRTFEHSEVGGGTMWRVVPHLAHLGNQRGWEPWASRLAAGPRVGSRQWASVSPCCSSRLTWASGVRRDRGPTGAAVQGRRVRSVRTPRCE